MVKIAALFQEKFCFKFSLKTGECAMLDVHVPGILIEMPRRRMSVTVIHTCVYVALLCQSKAECGATEFYHL